MYKTKRKQCKCWHRSIEMNVYNESEVNTLAVRDATELY